MRDLDNFKAELILINEQSRVSLIMPHQHLYRTVIAFNFTLEQSELCCYVHLIVFLRLYVRLPRTGVKKGLG